MREFKAGEGAGTKYIHALVGGRVNSGKTHFAATAPRPLFISDMAEGGFVTLDHMNPALWWDPACKPEVWAGESMMDYPKAITKLIEMAAKGGGKLKWDTLVFDSLSIYAQRVLREIKAGNPGGDGRARYGDLADALSLMVARVHTLPMHIIWLCHINDEMQLAVSGKATHAIWAYMDYKWLCSVDTTGKTNDYQLRTVPFRGADWLGGRSDMFSQFDPIIPSFKCVAEILGLPAQPVSPALPGYPDGASYK